MLTRRGFNQDLSYGAFDQGRLVSFTFNGIGNWNGKLTAYDIGTGTIAEYRQKGLAKQIFNVTETELKKAGIELYLLEVLQHNQKAVDLYRKAGFEVSREFDYYVSAKKDLDLNNKNNSDIEIKKIEFPTDAEVNNFHDFEPAWQNSFDSISRTKQDFFAFGAFIKNELVGYVICEEDNGDLTQIAVRKDHRIQKIASTLLINAFAQFPSENIKLINAESDKSAIADLLRSFNVKLCGKQFEMIKEL